MELSDQNSYTETVNKMNNKESQTLVDAQKVLFF